MLPNDMILTEDELTQVFQKALDEFILKQSFDPNPVFTKFGGGRVLAKRLMLCLRDPEWSYINHDGLIDCEELMKKAEPFLKNGVKIQGLNYVLFAQDLPKFREIHNKLFT